MKKISLFSLLIILVLAFSACTPSPSNPSGNIPPAASTDTVTSTTPATDSPSVVKPSFHTAPTSQEISSTSENSSSNTILTPSASPLQISAKIPVIMFHYIRNVDSSADPLGYNLSLDPQEFENILKYLQQEGYHTVHLKEVLSDQIPEKPIMLVFDDGYEDFYTTAFPLLQKYGLTASSAIITDKMDSGAYMTPAQVQEIYANGIEIFSHSKSHPDLRTSHDAEYEIEGSKKYLEDLLGTPIIGLVYPSGKYNEQTIELAQKAGYKAAFTTASGFADFSTNLFELQRLRSDNRDGLPGLKKKLQRG